MQKTKIKRRMSKWARGKHAPPTDRANPSFQISLPPSPSPPTPAWLAPGKTLPSFSSSASSSFVLVFPPPLAFIRPLPPGAFVLGPQRFRSPIVPSAFEICEETDNKREKDRGHGQGRCFQTLPTTQYSSPRRLKAPRAESKVNPLDKFSPLN